MQGDDDIYYYSYATSIVLLDLIIHISAGQKPVFITCMHILYYVYIPLYVPVATCCWYHLAFTHRSPCCICFFLIFLGGKKHCIVFALFDRTCTAHVVACNAIAKTHILQRDSPIAFFVCGYNNTQCKCKIKAVKLLAVGWLT